MEEKTLLGVLSLLQALVWPIFFLVLIWLAYRANLIAKLRDLADAIVEQIKKATEFQFGSLGWKVPKAVEEGRAPAATAEGVVHANPQAETAEFAKAANGEIVPATISNYPYLLHAAQILKERVGPRTGRYSVRIWIEFDSRYGPSRDDARSVTYILDKSFAGPKVIPTRTVGNGFELWLSVFGEFTIIAIVEFDSGEKVWLSRYLDLPGRPTD